MKKPTLLVLAAGMGSRYGGLKQMDGLGPNGETIIDYSIYDAIQAGFGKVVFVIRDSFKEEFIAIFETKLKGKITTDYVCQELDNIPKGIYINPERTKPWGTGHAVLVAKDNINEPFAVINADDFYGQEAFNQMYNFLVSEVKDGYCSIMGYELVKTLSANGTVSRGVCGVDSNNNLTEINERSDIESINGNIYWRDYEGEEHPLEDKTLVSMNFWGFAPSYFEQSEAIFERFLKEQGKELKSEFYIPFVVDELRKENKMNTIVIPTSSEWFGVTYIEDREPSVTKITKLLQKGVYPKKLWK